MTDRLAALRAALDTLVSRAPIVCSLVLQVEGLGEHDAEAATTLTLALRTLPGISPPCRVEARFFGVTRLRFAGGDGALTQVGSLQIEDLRDRGWEAARFRVYDEEQDQKISFLARDLELLATSS